MINFSLSIFVLFLGFTIFNRYILAKKLILKYSLFFFLRFKLFAYSQHANQIFMI